jgi:phage major head subunit gpT-like protein
MVGEDLNEESLNRIAEELKKLSADRGKSILMKPTHILMTGESLTVAKRMMEERGMTTLEELWHHMQKAQHSK